MLIDIDVLMLQNQCASHRCYYVFGHEAFLFTQGFHYIFVRLNVNSLLFFIFVFPGMGSINNVVRFTVISLRKETFLRKTIALFLTNFQKPSIKILILPL